MGATLVMEVMSRALGRRQIKLNLLLTHTNQGRKHRATAYRELMLRRKNKCNMSARSCCWDNAMAESFSSNLKEEMDGNGEVVCLISCWEMIRHLA